VEEATHRVKQQVSYVFLETEKEIG